MKTVAHIAVVLTLAACSSAPETGVATRDYTILGPFTHENLTIFLFENRAGVREDRDYLILEEALKEGTLRVTEQPQGAQVNLLELENTGARQVYIQAGDTVKGGQQDRTIAVDFVVPPKSGKMSIGAFCVEPGRWSGRGAANQAQIIDLPRATTNQFGALEFSLSEVPAATKEQKLAIRLEKSQSRVWAAGGLVTGRTIAGQPLTSSYVLATEAPEVRAKIADYVEHLEGVVHRKDHLVGTAFVVNGEPNTIDIYGSSRLFQKLWPKLLRGAALEAMMKKSNAGLSKPIDSRIVLDLIEHASGGEEHVETLPGEMKISVCDGGKAAAFNTEKAGALLHQQIIAK